MQVSGGRRGYPVNRWLVKQGWKEKMDHRTHLAQMAEKMRKEAGDEDRPTLRGRPNSRREDALREPQPLSRS